MKRRSFVAGGAALAGSAWLDGCLLPASRLQAGASGRDVDLASLQRLHVVRLDPISGRCAYVAETKSGSVDGPVFHARSGDSCDFTVENRLPQPTTLHLHGLTLPESADGAGFDPILPGESKRVQFVVRNRAGLYWMHSHAHGFTAEQVHSGLYALLLVHDAEDDALAAALSTGSGNQLALALSDVREANGTIGAYAPVAGECLHGWYGNRMLVNGALDAGFEVASGWVRLRLLNACNARGLLLAFQPRSSSGAGPRPFYLLGTDGGLLAAPRRVDRLFLYAAERVDIAIQIEPKETLQAQSLAFDPRHQIRGNGTGHGHPARDKYPPLSAAAMCASGDAPGSQLADGAAFPLFSLNSSGAAATGVPHMPEKLSFLGDASDSGAMPVRRLRLDFDEEHGFMIDNQSYGLDESGIGITRGSREIWEIRNSPISMPHPMHLHGFQFRVLRRQGTFGPARSLTTESNGRLPTDLGLKDTVTIWPNETLRIEVDFSLPRTDAFAGAQRYMFHCHNLEHEDGMMMRNIVIS